MNDALTFYKVGSIELVNLTGACLKLKGITMLPSSRVTVPSFFRDNNTVIQAVKKRYITIGDVSV